MFLICGILLLPLFANAFEVKTHKEITRKTIEVIESELNTYLVENLGLDGGLDEPLGDFTAREWMVKGSEFEDNRGRFFFHFHDPISDDGLGGLFSAISWSLFPQDSQLIGGTWSWNDAREYYLKALTLPTKTERDEQWANLFRALGQVMHLLQDQASPSHVRNDGHPALGGIGDPDGLHDFMKVRDAATYVGLGIISPDSSILEQPGATRSEPFSNLFDHNQYTGSNPGASLGGQAGLAEYANANFFSNDSIPGQSFQQPLSIFNPLIRNYSHPNIPELVPAQVPSPYLTLPRLGSSNFPGARAAKLTGNQAVATFLLTNTNFDLLGQLQLDDAVYDAQAQNLIPRAVGYSAAVLDYFFRLLFPLELSDHDFEVVGDPPTSECGPPPDPRYDGLLGVLIPTPSELNFNGTASLYYEKPDGSRVLGEQFDFPRPFPPFELSFGADIPLADLVQDQPIRWYVVLEGMVGPGTRETRAILANTDRAEWIYMCFG